MKVEEYISSGILESYVMDQLTLDERLEVERAAKDLPEVREELAKIELSLEALAFASAIAPDENLKARLLNQLDKTTEVIPINRNQSGPSLFKYAAAASFLIAIGSVLMALNYWTKWQSAEERLSDLIAQNEQFAENYNMVNQQLDDIKQSVAIMNSKEFKKVIMSGTDNSPNSLATVYWNPGTKAVYLGIQNLKELSQNQQYQLWAIIDGKPVNAGTFDSMGPDQLVLMENIDSAAAFAVTIEPRGGSVAPSLETMQVLGNV